MDICLRRFRPSGAESLSLACPRESNQREGHPRGRAFRAPALQVRRRATGFFDSTSCADEKLARIRASHPAGFPSPTCRALWGPLAHVRVRTRCQRVALVARRQAMRSCMVLPHGTSPSRPSCPRKRASIVAFGIRAPWMPAFAGMTAMRQVDVHQECCCTKKQRPAQRAGGRAGCAPARRGP